MDDNDIERAFDRMAPDDDARTRMLAAILATADDLRAKEAPDEIRHQRSRGLAGESDGLRAGKPSDEDNMSKGERTNVSRETFGFEQREERRGTRSKNRKRSVWAVGLPLAACLILLTGIGIFAMTSLLADNQSQGAGPNALREYAAESSADAPINQSEAPESREDEPAGAPDGSEERPDAPLSKDSSSDPSAATESLPQQYPLVESEQIGRLSLVNEGRAGAGIADPSLVGKEIGAAKAMGADGSSTIGCVIYEYPTTDALYYAVRYDGDPAYYLALPSA